MDLHSQAIKLILKDKDVRIEEASLKLHHSAGFMSKVFVADSNVGRVIIHVGKVNSEQKRQKIWEKIEVVGKVLHSFKIISAAEILATGFLEDTYIIIQRFIEGHNAGERVLKNSIIGDEWRNWSEELEQDFERHLAYIHEIPLEGYGWIVKEDNQAKGKYKTWIEFLETEIKIWCEGIKGEHALIKLVQTYFQKHKSDLVCEGARLVHADITNPGNILVKENRVTGIIDWEWALAGDPAWEFGFNNRCILNTYFETVKKPLSAQEKSDFIKRAEVYGVLFLLWVLYIHTDSKNNIYKAALKNLEKLNL